MTKPKFHQKHKPHTKSAHKKLSARKRIERRQNQSLQKLYSKFRQSIGEKPSNNDSCVVDESNDNIHNLTDGKSVLFIEDRNGNENIINCKTMTPKVHYPKSPHRPLKSQNHSTPISKKNNKNLNISNLSAVKTSPQRLSQETTRLEDKANKNDNINDISAIKMSQQRLSREIHNISEEISNKYTTIDLTGFDSSKTVIDLTKRTNNNSVNSSIIDLEDGECSMSASDSDVTVISVVKGKSKHRQIAEGIAKMNNSEKDRLLKMITDNIFSGCNVARKTKRPVQSTPAEDSYIKYMIEGNIRDSIGANVYNPPGQVVRTGPRMIVIDGSNVAAMHGNGTFSVKGLKICIDYFLKRGHTVKAFVPQFRMCRNNSSDPEMLRYLQGRGLVVGTPSRRLIDGRCIASYDDRFIVQCAAEFGGIIVSQDRYRDLIQEHPQWTEVIEKRLLQFTWVQDMIMFPVDPLGRFGPKLDEFLMHPVRCVDGNDVVTIT